MAEAVALLLVLGFPIFLTVVLFRRHLQDAALRRTLTAGLVMGAAAVLLVKLACYPPLRLVLGQDLHSFLAAEHPTWVKLLVLVGIVGGIEEGMKAIGLGSAVRWAGAEDRPAAYLLAGVATGVGFSCLENLDYLQEFGLNVLLLREGVSTTAHACFSGGVGALAARGLSAHRPKGIPGPTWWLAIAVGALLHGGFNFLAILTPLAVSLPGMGLFLIAVLAILRESWFRLLTREAAAIRHSWGCGGCGAVNPSGGRFCVACGRLHPGTGAIRLIGKTRQEVVTTERRNDEPRDT